MAQQGGPQPDPNAPAQAPAPVAPAQDSQAVPADIVASGTRLPASQYHTGLLHGSFGVGHTGGNILGMLGDAFLTQAGRAPQYAPRLMQAREAEALQNYGSNPDDALKLYSQVNPIDALRQYGIRRDDDRQQSAADSVIADQKQNRELKTRGVVGAMINASNEKTFPDMIKRAQAYASANGLDETLPSDLDSAKAWASGSDSIGDQNKNAALEAYRAQMMDYRNRTEKDKADYYKGSLGVRQQQANTGQQRADQQGGHLTAADAERAAHDRATEAYNNAHPRGSGAKAGAGAAGAPTWDPAKGKYVFK
jgi:hypothetical protein